MLLTNLRVGQTGVITSVSIQSPLYKRLLDIGFSKGAKIKCLMESPLKDPRAYLIKGAVIALRDTDANLISVRCS